MLLTVVISSMTVGSAFAMLGQEMDAPATLQRRLLQDINFYEFAVAGEEKSLGGSNLELQDALNDPRADESERVKAELCVRRDQLQVAREKVRLNCNQRILDRLNQSGRNLDFFSNDPVIRQQAREVFNRFAAEEMQRTQAEITRQAGELNGIVHVLQRKDIQGQHALLAKLRESSVLKNNNAGSSTGTKSFFTNNRNYIAGVAITAAVVGTIYFYGHRIKAWITGKPVQEKHAATEV